LGVSDYIGLDGATYVFRNHKGRTQCILSWWSSGPQQWHLFTEWVNKLILYMDDELRKVSEPRHRLAHELYDEE
jgi:hypothetical protein